MENLQYIESIKERDIDLLFLEEINCNPNFRNYFIDLLNLPKIDEFKGAWRSISDYNLGETDILIYYISNNRKYYILIENKLDAEFQEKQYERYLKRKEIYIKENKCNNCFIVLISPLQYSENQDEFEIIFNYEEMQDFFEKQQDQRSIYKSELIKIAIEKSRRGYQTLNNPLVLDFWKKYWSLRELKYPNLKMNKPTKIAIGSDWFFMKVDWNNEFHFVHKMGKGFIDAIFYDKNYEQLKNEMYELPSEYSVKQLKKSVAIRSNVPILDRMMPFEEQSKEIEDCLKAIYQMNEFLRTKM